MLASIALITGFILESSAFWRMECPSRLGLARMDPIFHPNEASPHAHSIHGSNGFYEGAETADLLGGDCTSCRVTQDKSAYWTPSLYFEDAQTGEFELVPQVGGMLACYLLYGDNITGFPRDFRMVSGNNNRRKYTVGDPSKPDPEKSQWASLGQISQDTLAQRAIGFNCLNYATVPEGTLYRHYFPSKAYLDQYCPEGIRLEVMFPSCWKGGDALDSKSHKDHMAFPDLVMTGTCPEGYPIRTPSLLFETTWNTYALKGRHGRFVFSNGDVTGYGYHGDFMMGWDVKFLQNAINTCTNPSGRIEDCPLFDVISESKAASCKLKKPSSQILLSENVLGPMISLPGGVKADNGMVDFGFQDIASALEYHSDVGSFNSSVTVSDQVSRKSNHLLTLSRSACTSCESAAERSELSMISATKDTDFSCYSIVHNNHGDQIAETVSEQQTVTITVTEYALSAAITLADAIH